MLNLFKVRLSNEKIRQSAALAALQGSKELTADLESKPAIVPAFIPFGLEFREHLYLPTSQAIGYQKDLGVKHNRI
jgi:hypothetical protein